MRKFAAAFAAFFMSTAHAETQSPVIDWLRSFSPAVVIALDECGKDSWVVGGYIPEFKSYQWIHSSTKQGVVELLTENMLPTEIIYNEVLVVPESVCKHMGQTY